MGRPQTAADILSEVKNFPSRDRLLLFMEKGLILHQLGRYEDSIEELLQASRLMEQQEIISISRETSSLITTEWITEYKGEYCERLWVHTYLMMDYLQLYKYEDALVEAKQALKILTEYPKALSGDYFTRALIALCYENLHEFSDAYIEYKKLADMMSEPSAVAFELYRLGSALGFTSEAGYYKKYVPKDKIHLFSRGSAAELVLFAGLGSSPIKISGNIVIPPSIRFSFPWYKDRVDRGENVAVFDSTDSFHAVSITTDIGNVARASLHERATRMIAKETARVAAKETVAQAVGKRNDPLVTALLRMGMFIMEEPDTRCWQTLPASLKMLRLPLKPGKHNIRIAIFGKSKEVVKEIKLPAFSVSSGQRVYFSIRASNKNLILGEAKAQ